VGGTLFVRHRNESDARRREDVQGVHERRADDTEDVGHALRDQRFHEGLRRRHPDPALHDRTLQLRQVGLLHVCHAVLLGEGTPGSRRPLSETTGLSPLK
jgi:hypothetical protein